MKCPRRIEGAVFKFNDQEDEWRKSDNTCNYCGSLNPDMVMARLENKDVEITPTDKNYKIYVGNKGGERFKQSFRDCPKDATCKGPDDCTHWVTKEHDYSKFYFQHLSVEQKKRFVELFNEKKLILRYPGHFYVLPFFMKK